MSRAVTRDALWIAVAASLYYLTSRLGLSFVVQPGGYAMMWPASGVVFGALLVTRRPMWPLLLAAVFTVTTVGHLAAGHSLLHGMAFSAAGCFESGLAAWVIWRLLGREPDLGVVRDVVLFLAAGPVVSNGLTALAAGALMHSTRGIPVANAWFTWWVEDGVGMLIVAPAFIAAKQAIESRAISLKGHGQTVLFLVCLAALAFGVFATSPWSEYAFISRPDLLFPAVVYAAWRFGPSGATVATLVVSVAAFAGAMYGVGPFHSRNDSLLDLMLHTEVFLAVLGATAMTMAAAAAERRAAMQVARSEHEALEAFFDSAPFLMGLSEIEDDQLYLVASNASLKRFVGEVRPASAVAVRDLGFDKNEVRLWLDKYRESHKTGRPVQFEYERKVDGALAWASATVTYVGEAESGRSRYGFIIEDITERKKAEQQRIATEEKLRTYADTQRVLLREVNHRVKNNLSAIMGIIHLEEDRAAGANRGDVTQIMREMEARVRSLATVHTILSAGEWHPVPLHDLCTRIMRNALVHADHHAVAPVINVTESSVLVDARQAHNVALVLSELATNSLKYGAGAAGLVAKIDIRDCDGQIVLTYRDNGAGFCPSVLADESTPGVGLALVRGLVRQSLLGDIKLSNDNGAVATICFRKSPPEETPVPAWLPLRKNI